MKKTNKCLLLALSFTLSASILSACGTPSEEPSSSDSSSAVCQHTYDDACDADCNLCGEERTPSEHVYEDDCDVDCNVCGEERTPSEHVYDDDCDVDCNVCGDVREITHAYDDDCDTECNVCGNPRDAVHTYTKENYDVTHHWNECPDCGTMDETTKEEHEYELDDTDESVDKLICDCDAEASSFNKVVTEQRQQVILSDESVSISLAGVSEYESVVLAMFGEYDLGTDLNALDVSAFKADTANHGEQTIMVIVKDAAGFEHTITVPVFFVTAKISTAEDWAKVQLTAATGSVYGHYVLGADIELSGTVSSAYASPVQGESYGFKGTLDGNGKTVTFASVGSGGLFGGIGEGAVIKNITFTGTSVNPAYHKSIFGATVLNATFENVTVNVKGDDGNDGSPIYGILAAHSFSGNTCKNFNVVIEGNFASLFGGSNSALWGFNGAGTCTFENSSVTVKEGYTLGELGHKGDPSGTNENSPLTVYTVNDVQGLTMNSYDTLDISLNKVNITKQTEFTIVLGEGYEGYTAIAVKLGEKELGSSLTLTVENVFTAEHIGEQTLTVVATKGNSTVTITVPVKVTDGTLEEVEATLTMTQDVILSAETAAISLGTEYADYTVTSIKYGDYDLGTDLSALTISDELKADTQNHGLQNIIVVAQNDTYKATITVPVTLVTKAIAVATDWSALQPQAGTQAVYGYYILADNVAAGDTSITASVFVSTSTTGEYGFRGTLDGRGYELSFKITAQNGIFGAVGSGALIKDMTFTVDNLNPGYRKAVFGGVLANATFEDVTINLNNAVEQTEANYGALAYQGVRACTFTNVEINISGAVNELFDGDSGAYWGLNGGGAMCTFTDCTINLAAGATLKELGHCSSTVYIADGCTTTEGTKVSGIKIVTSAT